MGPKKLAAIGCLSVFAIFLAITVFMGATHSLIREYQVVESEGHRQREYKLFGVIPYEKQEQAPEIHVRDDYWSAVAHSGLVVGPEVDRTRDDMMIIRMLRKTGNSYYLRATIKGDYSKLVAFYTGQVKAHPYVGRTTTFVAPVKTTGREVNVLLDLRTKGLKPGEDEIDFGLGVDAPPAKTP